MSARRLPLVELHANWTIVRCGHCGRMLDESGPHKHPQYLLTGLLWLAWAMGSLLIVLRYLEGA